MKNLILVSCLLFVVNACNNNKNQSEITKQEHYLNYDDELDIKSTAKVDSIAFRNHMSKILSPNRIVELFGSGYQSFYLLLEINDNGKNYFMLSPEAGSWTTGLGNIERGLFKENLELTNDYVIIPQNAGDPKAVNIKDIFYSHNALFDQTIFKTEAGTLGGKKVRSGKAYQIDISILENGVITRPWTIREIDIAKFRTKLESGLTREYYMGFFPAVLKYNYKFLKDRIDFPKEAVTRGVSGKVFVKLFFEDDGKYSGYQLIKGLGYGVEDAVIRAINDFPPSAYATGERTTLILPFSFGASKNVDVDVMVKSFEYNPAGKHNKLKMVLVNKLKAPRTSRVKYAIYVFLNDKIILADKNVTLNWDPNEGMSYYFGGNNIKPGTYNYRVSIDPENILNDVDRSNNTVRGKLVVK